MNAADSSVLRMRSGDGDAICVGNQRVTSACYAKALPVGCARASRTWSKAEPASPGATNCEFLAVSEADTDGSIIARSPQR
jgi:hypothetical protein